MTTTLNRYWLGDGAQEIDHLVRQAEIYAPEAEQLLDAIGVEPGASAIDLGCGVLGILHLLGERVGPGGRIVGLDVEPKLIELARTVAARHGVAAQTIQADAAATGLEGDSFDLVHARTLLINLTEPELAVREMVRLARPGGTVALQEPDTAGWICEPPHPSFGVLRAELVATYPRTGKTFDMGRRLARLLRDAGLRDIAVRATARVTRPGDYYHTFLLTLCELLREPLLRGGGLTAAELDVHVGALRAHLADPDSLTAQPLLWQAWGVKP